jgi:hypothetical protein
MNEVVLGMYAGDWSHLDRHAMGRNVMEWYALSLEQGLASRARLPEELFVDCSQQEFVESPLQLVEKVYAAFDLDLTAGSRSVLHSHIEANPKGKHGRHDYQLEDYGLTREMIADRFEFYTSEQRWPISS